MEAWKIQDFNRVWTVDLAIPVRRSNQLTYEATDVGNCSFVGSNEPMRNEWMMKWYMKYDKWGFGRSRVQTPLKSWIFQASIRNCKNCVHNYEDHSLFDFTSAVQYMIYFIYHFIKRVMSIRGWARNKVGAVAVMSKAIPYLQSLELIPTGTPVLSFVKTWLALM